MKTASSALLLPSPSSLMAAFLAILALAIPSSAAAQSASACSRYQPGSVITPPKDLYSQNGVLKAHLTYRTANDATGNQLFCFVADDGSQSPTLHVNPGDRILLTIDNAVPDDAGDGPMSGMRHHAASPDSRAPAQPGPNCTGGGMLPSSVNIHFHGTNTPAACHQDEVIHTIINSGESFQYDLQIPADEPPGLYWYHPHVHGISENAVLGGASGVIVVEGLENINAATAGLAQQILVVRDNVVPGDDLPDDAPAKDLSLNYVPVPYPNYPPARIMMKPGETQLWRVLNASADTILDLQLNYDGQPQPLEIVGLDGVPTGSQDGRAKGSIVNQNHVLIPPAGRAEFIIAGPAAAVKNAQLVTLNVDTGPDGDNDPARPIANIQTSGASATPAVRTMPTPSRQPPQPRFANLAQAQPTATRSLYFSEISLDPGDPDASVIFFITVNGQSPQAFDPDHPPAIVTTEGAVEDWTIENHSMENHEFHIHQIHFLQVAQNGEPITSGQYQDTIDVPHWDGTGPYPSVTLRMDFRGVAPGDFVYHCHILEHEDGGMMAIIRVLPAVRRPPK